MKRIAKVLLVVIIALSLCGCEVLNQMATQTQQMLNLKNCNFDVTGLNQVEMFGLTLDKNMKKEDLSVGQLLQLTNAIREKKLPISFNVNMNVDNPNDIPASMSKMDYIIALNGKEVISSTLSQGINVNAKSQSAISIPVSTDLFQLFSGETADAIVNLAFKLAGASSNPVDLSVKVKPYIKINNQALAYPDYITLNKTLN